MTLLRLNKPLQYPGKLLPQDERNLLLRVDWLFLNQGVIKSRGVRNEVKESK